MRKSYNKLFVSNFISEIFLDLIDVGSRIKTIRMHLTFGEHVRCIQKYKFIKYKLSRSNMSTKNTGLPKLQSKHLF